MILPNLLNLDPKVIDIECREFTELIVTLKELRDSCEPDDKCELLRSIFKVFNELNSRFPSFSDIFKKLTGENSN